MCPGPKKTLDSFFKLVDKLPKALRNTQKNSLPCSRFDLEANSDKLIFEKVVFVGNRVITPTHERVVVFC